MAKNKSPFVSVIILNYYGEKVISKTIESVLNSNYDPNKFEIIIVDNNSQDKSIQIIEEISTRYSKVKLIKNKKNSGFAGGNNLGIKVSRGKFVVLLNNDCVVDKNWLSSLVACATGGKKTFAVTSKIYLYPKYLNISVKSKLGSIDRCSLTKSHLLDLFRLAELPLTIIGEERSICRIEVPFDPNDDEEIELSLVGEKNDVFDMINFKKHEYKLSKDNLLGHYNLHIKISNKRILKMAHDKIQSAGTIVFQDGYGRDRGAIVRYQTQNYEYDSGQYNLEQEVYAGNGAALLLDKAILDQIGLLDETFFMYYEDVEICERARLHGYIIKYTPQAIVRHFHSLSSKEWSPTFIFNAEKGRLLHIYYAFPFRIYFKQYLKFLFKTIMKTAISIKYPSKIKRFNPQLKTCIYFLLNIIPIFLNKKLIYQDIKKSSVEDNYWKIIQGYWYK